MERARGDTKRPSERAGPVANVRRVRHERVHCPPDLVQVVPVAVRVAVRSVVSHDAEIPGWKPTRVEKTEDRQVHTVYLYELPVAKQ